MRQYPIKWPPVLQIVVVLCIIAFVVAFLFPVFQKAREHSRPVYCHTNLMQLGLAMLQYTQDADENFPPGVNAAGNGWAGQLYPFVKSTGVYQCTKDQQEGSYISYAENQNLVRLPLKKLANPIATVELYEFSTLNCDPSTPETVSATGLNAPQDSPRHDSENYSLNFLMTDGHVKWLTPEKVSNGPNAVSPKILPSGTYLQTFAVK